MKSASIPGQVGDEGINPKKRGWSIRAANGRISRAARSITSNAGRPSSGGVSASCLMSPSLNSPSQAFSPGSPSIRSHHKLRHAARKIQHHVRGHAQIAEHLAAMHLHPSSLVIHVLPLDSSDNRRISSGAEVVRRRQTSRKKEPLPKYV